MSTTKQGVRWRIIGEGNKMKIDEVVRRLSSKLLQMWRWGNSIWKDFEFKEPKATLGEANYIGWSNAYDIYTHLRISHMCTMTEIIHPITFGYQVHHRRLGIKKMLQYTYTCCKIIITISKFGTLLVGCSFTSHSQKLWTCLPHDLIPHTQVNIGDSNTNPNVA